MLTTGPEWQDTEKVGFDCSQGQKKSKGHKLMGIMCLYYM